MPSSYQSPSRGDKKSPAMYSQSTLTNTSSEQTLVGKLLAGKKNAVHSIRPQATLHEAVELLREKRIGALLVLNAQGHLQGILSERDIVRKLAEIPGETLAKQVQDAMTAKVETCTNDDSLVSALRRMTDGHFRHMPVVDGNRVVGMITVGDAVNYRLIELEHEALQMKQLIVG